MGIASFSPSPSVLPSGSSGLSMVLAPVQALVAFFMPVQNTQASHRPLVHMPSQRLATRHSIIQHTRTVVYPAASERPVSRLRVMREFEPGMARSQAGRMVISGRMSDVCAELDRIAQ
ncbi:MAG: hypothetical protein ACK5A0_04720 [Polaromonas sp.]|jgi:hypothetical protein